MLDTRDVPIHQDHAAVTVANDLFNQAAERIERDMKRIAGRDHLEQASLGGQERFRASALVDVRVQDKPAQDAAGGVAHRKATDVKPPIHAVRPTDAMFEVVRLAVPDRLRPRGDHARKVVGVDGIARRPVPEFLERLAEVVEEVVINECDVAIARGDGDQAGDAVDDLTKRKVLLHKASDWAYGLGSPSSRTQ